MFQFNKETSVVATEPLTPEGFVKRYFESTDSFKGMLADLSEFAPSLQANLEAFLGFAKDEEKVNSVIRRRIHKKTDMPYVMFIIGVHNGDVPVMLFDHGNIAQFVHDYQKGLVKIDFTYNQLTSYIHS